MKRLTWVLVPALMLAAGCEGPTAPTIEPEPEVIRVPPRPYTCVPGWAGPDCSVWVGVPDPAPPHDGGCP